MSSTKTPEETKLCNHTLIVATVEGCKVISTSCTLTEGHPGLCNTKSLTAQDNEKPALKPAGVSK